LEVSYAKLFLHTNRDITIDIVAQQKDYLVFVEVRTKSSSDFGTPEESITQRKQEKLVALALAYINAHQNLPPLWRIDVVAVEVDQKGKAKRIELIQNAIQPGQPFPLRSSRYIP
jgi:putative endonuclease